VENASNDSLIMFSSFFSAIQNFIHEIVKSETIGLKNLDLGPYQVNVSSFNEFDLEVVTVIEAIDKKELKSITKIHERIKEVLNNHKNKFDWPNWNGDISIFSFLTVEIGTILQNLRIKDKIQIIPKQIEEKLLSGESQMFKVPIEVYATDIELYKNRLKKVETFPEKFEILEKLAELNQKINDSSFNDYYQQLNKKITQDFEETKIKAKMYLTQLKTNINTITNNLRTKNFDESRVRDIFLPLYSFSGKLRILGQNEKSEEYKALASSLMNKETLSVNERFEIVLQISRLDEDVNSYLK
jgi:hypothetical protein